MLMRSSDSYHATGKVLKDTTILLRLIEANPFKVKNWKLLAQRDTMHSTIVDYLHAALRESTNKGKTHVIVVIMTSAVQGLVTRNPIKCYCNG